MFALISFMLAFGATVGQSPDVACADAKDRPACAEQACHVASGLDFDASECDGLAAHLRANPPCYWEIHDNAQAFAYCGANPSDPACAYDDDPGPPDDECAQW